MTVEKNSSKVRYVANGITNRFDVPFKFFKNKDGTAQLAVTMGDAGDIQQLTEGIDYTVEGEKEAAGGAVFFIATPEENKTIVILRNMPFTQDVDFMNGEDFDGEQYEMSLDEIIMTLQQMAEIQSRAITIDALSEEDPNTLVQQLLGYKNAAVKAANDALGSSNSAFKSAEDAKESANHAQEILDGVLEAGDLQVTNINNAGATNLNSINSAGTMQVNIINTTGDNQVAKVVTEGNIQIVNVRSEGASIISQATEQAQFAEQSAENASSFANNAAQSAVEAAAQADRAEKAAEDIHLVPATKESIGIVIIGDGVDVDETGKISVPCIYNNDIELPQDPIVTIMLDENINVYKVTPRFSGTRIRFDPSKIDISKQFTFEVRVDMSVYGVRSIIFESLNGETISWAAEAPSMTAPIVYALVFTCPKEGAAAGDKVYIGNLAYKYMPKSPIDFR